MNVDEQFRPSPHSTGNSFWKKGREVRKQQSSDQDVNERASLVFSRLKGFSLHMYERRVGWLCAAVRGAGCAAGGRTDGRGGRPAAAAARLTHSTQEMWIMWMRWPSCKVRSRGVVRRSERDKDAGEYALQR